MQNVIFYLTNTAATTPSITPNIGRVILMRLEKPSKPVSKLCMLNNGRIAVVELGNTEMKTADIVKIDCFKPPSVQQAVKRFREAGRIEDRPRKRQTPIPTTPKKIQKNRC
ncbi:hypothetical protein KIN20_031273 [Parelaphostrongylus tenuis]|uniref:Uncharacterized protein n=1 Tax=Parelaphostrongylus tenuis TaxID=148309 RepID=A0AAD5WGW7_PARTN|nr:hypothetical protein KIN20_031273 [Parelaphostrongylus tenuis]